MDFWKDKQPLFVVIPVDILTSFNFGKDYWLSSLNWKEFPFAFRSLIPGQGLNVRSVVIRNKGFWAMRNQSMLDPFIMVGFWERSFLFALETETASPRLRLSSLQPRVEV